MLIDFLDRIEALKGNATQNLAHLRSFQIHHMENFLISFLFGNQYFTRSTHNIVV